MERHPNDLTTDAEIDAAFERAKVFDKFPTIVEAVYRGEPGLEFLMLRLSDGQRLLVPREKLGELKDATPEQAADLEIGPHGLDIWWKQLDDGLYLPDFLEHRWGKEFLGVAA
ncbi:MAG: DUF2442 domain-containing protein [Acidobacteriota bacterium]|nr:DUF2442 domain-containing protein [Acidobacteriota bacterium]